jgi:hypothetical protein
VKDYFEEENIIYRILLYSTKSEYFIVFGVLKYHMYGTLKALKFFEKLNTILQCLELSMYSKDLRFGKKHRAALDFRILLLM